MLEKCMSKLYKKITKEEAKLLKQTFPKPEMIIAKEKCFDFYQVIAVSVFEHWLGEKEASKFFDVSKDVQSDRYQRHLNLCNVIFRETAVYGVRYRSCRKVNQCRYRQFAGKYSFMSIVSNNINDGDSCFILFLPDLEAIYCQGFDDTNYLYYQNKDKLDQFKNWVKESRLHILELV